MMLMIVSVTQKKIVLILQKKKKKKKKKKKIFCLSYNGYIIMVMKLSILQKAVVCKFKFAFNIPPYLFCLKIVCKYLTIKKVS